MEELFCNTFHFKKEFLQTNNRFLYGISFIYKKVVGKIPKTPINWFGVSVIYLEILKKIQRKSAMLSALTWHLSLCHFPTTATWLPCAFSKNIFMVIVLMCFFIWYLDFINLSTVVDWQQDLVVLQLKWFDVTISSITVSSLTVLACGTLFQPLNSCSFVGCSP